MSSTLQGQHSEAGPSDQVMSYEKWRPLLPELKTRYQRAQPFPHVVLDDFLEPQVVREAAREVPAPDSEAWSHYVHVNERKLGSTNRKDFPPHVGMIVDALNAPRFLAFLSELTGIPELQADETLEGGGMHQIRRGGFLNVHADFTVHPKRRNLRRRVNVLLYLNEDWLESYGGNLELWEKDMSQCAHRIQPLINRAVIFNTDEDAYHGHPDKLTCPEDRTRKSIALYYFTEGQGAIHERSTEYKARPSDGLKSVAIFADKMALRAYDFAKRRLGLDDRTTARILKLISRKR
jgi:Rps23 Pro-64 3,4-dihydroxylase Tpa1-like proline 4-hydroxylase